jgi:hypothetical protein
MAAEDGDPFLGGGVEEANVYLAHGRGEEVAVGAVCNVTPVLAQLVRATLDIPGLIVPPRDFSPVQKAHRCAVRVERGVDHLRAESLFFYQFT